MKSMGLELPTSPRLADSNGAAESLLAVRTQVESLRGAIYDRDIVKVFEHLVRLEHAVHFVANRYGLPLDRGVAELMRAFDSSRDPSDLSTPIPNFEAALASSTM